MSVPTIPVSEPTAGTEPASESPAKVERAPLRELLPTGTLRAVVVTASVLLVVGSFARFGFSGTALVGAVFCPTLVLLAVIDLKHKLLPNRIVFPSLVAGVVLLGVAAALGPGVHAWIRALAGAAISFAIFLALAIISPRGMGMGDVKLAAVLGLALAYQGWGRLFLGFLLAFASGAVGGIALIVVRRAGRKSEIPFGPYLALGTAVAILFGGPLVHAWLPGFDPRYLR